jgi:hypothetical protein
MLHPLGPDSAMSIDRRVLLLGVKIRSLETSCPPVAVHLKVNQPAFRPWIREPKCDTGCPNADLHEDQFATKSTDAMQAVPKAGPRSEEFRNTVKWRFAW